MPRFVSNPIFSSMQRWDRSVPSAASCLLFSRSLDKHSMQRHHEAILMSLLANRGFSYHQQQSILRLLQMNNTDFCALSSVTSDPSSWLKGAFEELIASSSSLDEKALSDAAQTLGVCPSKPIPRFDLSQAVFFAGDSRKDISEIMCAVERHVTYCKTPFRFIVAPYNGHSSNQQQPCTYHELDAFWQKLMVKSEQPGVPLAGCLSNLDKDDVSGHFAEKTAVVVCLDPREAMLAASEFASRLAELGFANTVMCAVRPASPKQLATAIADVVIAQCGQHHPPTAIDPLQP